MEIAHRNLYSEFGETRYKEYRWAIYKNYIIKWNGLYRD